MLRQLIRDQKVLWLSGAICFAGLIVLVVVSIFDSYQILGINRWIKPMKFCISIATYLWTLVVLPVFCPGQRACKKGDSLGSVASDGGRDRPDNNAGGAKDDLAF